MVIVSEFLQVSIRVGGLDWEWSGMKWRRGGKDGKRERGKEESCIREVLNVLFSMIIVLGMVRIGGRLLRILE